MTDGQLRVTIIQDKNGAGCEGACGVDWAKTESKESLRSALKARFGERVTLSFVDPEKPSNATETAIVEQVRASGAALPVLLVDGERRIAGYFDVRMACDMVEAALEMTIE